MAPKLVLSLLLTTILFQTLTLTITANIISTPNPATNVIANQLKLMAKRRFELNEQEFNQTMKSFRRLVQRPDIENIVKNMSKIYPGNPKKQAVETTKTVLKNNLFVYPKIRSFTAFDWLMRFTHQVNVGNSILPVDGTLYRCFKAMYPACMEEAGSSKVALVLQRYECSYRFYTNCEYEDYRFANRRELPLLDFNALN